MEFWDAAKGIELTTFRGHSGSVYAVAWSPDGQRIASGSEDRTIKIWDATTIGNGSTKTSQLGEADDGRQRDLPAIHRAHLHRHPRPVHHQRATAETRRAAAGNQHRGHRRAVLRQLRFGRDEGVSQNG